jgi:glycosyltransferase involved in cell wall biosynthesis
MPDLPKLDPIADSPLSVVLLARDGAGHVADSLAAWLGFLDGFRPGAYELILADDGSGDGTADLAQALVGAHPALRVVRLDQPRGEGAALRAGLEATTKPLVFYTLCDAAYRPEMLGQLFERKINLDEGGEVKEIDHVHLMAGFRAAVKVSPVLRVLGWLWRATCTVLFAYTPRPVPGELGIRRRMGWLLARVLFGLRHRDVACPFRLMRREVLARAPIQSDGPFAHVELLAKANFVGHLMADEVPLDVRPPAYRGDARAFLADGRKVFDRPDFGPAVLPANG